MTFIVIYMRMHTFRRVGKPRQWCHDFEIFWLGNCSPVDVPKEFVEIFVKLASQILWRHVTLSLLECKTFLGVMEGQQASQM